MVSERNRSLDLIKFLRNKGIEVNVGKNKARGNKGIFKFFSNGAYRIDISKTLDEESVFSVLIHEYAHYVHYCYEPKLVSLDFVFDDFSDEIREELIRVTVDLIPQKTAAELYERKTLLNNEIKSFAALIKRTYPEFKLSSAFRPIEKTLGFQLKYLLKYDRVNFINTIYSVEDVENDFPNLPPRTDCVYQIEIQTESA